MDAGITRQFAQQPFFQIADQNAFARVIDAYIALQIVHASRQRIAYKGLSVFEQIGFPSINVYIRHTDLQPFIAVHFGNPFQEGAMIGVFVNPYAHSVIV